MIAHIIVMPHEHARDAIFAPGAPVAYYDARYPHDPVEDFGWVCDTCVCWPSTRTTEAPRWEGSHLVLMRNRKIRDEGFDRVRNVWRSMGYTPSLWRVQESLRSIFSEGRALTPVDIRLLLALFVTIGTVVFLDDEGREVAP